MTSLQKTFQYHGDSSNSPIESVMLFFEIPTYEFLTVFSDRKPFFERVHRGEHILQLDRKLKSVDYAAFFANELLIGKTDLSVKNFKSFYAGINFIGDDTKLDSLSASVSVHIKDEAENVFGHVVFDALYSFPTSSEKYANILERQRLLNSSAVFNEAEADKLEAELIDYLRNNIFLVNRERNYPWICWCKKRNISYGSSQECFCVAVQ